MRVCIADYETFWSTEHSLNKMSPIAYCLDPKTELQSLSLCVDDGPVHFAFGEQAIAELVASIDWSDVLLVGHNMSQFDAMLAAWRSNITPAKWGCTLAMAKPIYQRVGGLSLANLCKMIGIGLKGSLDAVGTKGRYCKDFTAEEIRLMKEYNTQDVELTRSLYYFLRDRTFDREMDVIDFTIRMLVDPALKIDRTLLSDALAVEQERKRNAIYSLQKKLEVHTFDEVKKALMSGPKLEALLAAQGCDAPKKISPATGKETNAFAATDEAFLALRDHPNPIVGDIIETRLGIKSSLLETRIQSYLDIEAIVPGGRMPIALNYWGATTGRWSGSMKINQQNLPRVNGTRTDVLRNSLVAPSGHKIVVADLSGVELRVNHFLWGVPSSIALFRGDARADLYTHYASMRWGIPAEEVTKAQRQFAKAMQLGLGFGMGWAKFQRVTKMQGIVLSDSEARIEVGGWRNFYREIVDGWDSCQRAITAMYTNKPYVISDAVDFLRTGPNELLTPYGKLRYPYLTAEQTEKGAEYSYGANKFKSKLYGGLLCENIVQHLARQILVGHILEIQTRYPVAHIVHDEVILVVPEHEAAEALTFVLDVMRASPDWWPEIVLWAEGSIANSYGACK